MSNHRISTIFVQKVEPNDKTANELVKTINRTLPNGANNWNLLHVFTILGTTTLCLSPQLLIPRQNSIYYPDSRHQSIITASSILSLISAIRALLDCSIFTMKSMVTNIALALKMFASFFLPSLGLFYLSYYFWTSTMKYEHPMPFLGFFVFFNTWCSFMCSLWTGIIFPSELWIDKTFRSCIRMYAKYEMWWFIVDVQRDLLSFAFQATSGYNQLMFAILIPAIKEFNKRILIKIISKLPENGDNWINVLLVTRLNINFALFIAIRMNGAERLTVVGILLVDFLMQCKMTRNIIQLNPKVAAQTEQDDRDNSREKAILKLILAELIEGAVPLTYAIGFSMAFFGPNKHISGNVGTDTWAYKKVEDIKGLFMTQMLLFGVDSVCVILNALLLYKFGNINLIQEFCKVLKGYWMIFAVFLAHATTVYFAFNDINAALDMTLQFEWITKEGRLKFIYNTMDISDYEKAVLLANNSLV